MHGPNCDSRTWMPYFSGGIDKTGAGVNYMDLDGHAAFMCAKAIVQ